MSKQNTSKNKRLPRKTRRKKQPSFSRAKGFGLLKDFPLRELREALTNRFGYSIDIVMLSLLVLSAGMSHLFFQAARYLWGSLLLIPALACLIYFLPASPRSEAGSFHQPLFRNIRLRLPILLPLILLFIFLGQRHIDQIKYFTAVPFYAVSLVLLIFLLPTRNLVPVKPPSETTAPLWKKLDPFRIPLLLFGILLIMIGQNSFQAHANYIGLFWSICGGILVCPAFYRAASLKNTLRRSSWRGTIDLPIIILVSLIGLAWRLYSLELIPPGCSVDEGLAGALANELLAGAKYPVFHRNVQFQVPITYYEVLHVAAKFLPTSSLATIRSVSAVAGTLSLVFFYLLLLEVYGRRIAIIGTLLLSSWTVHLIYSRVAWMWIFVILCGVSTFYFFYRARRTGFNRDYILAGICMGLGQHFYTASKLIPMVILAMVTFGILRQRGYIKRHLLGLSLMGIASLIVYSPLIVFALRYPKDYWNWIGVHYFFRGIPSHLYDYICNQFLNNIGRHFMMFVSRSSWFGYFNLPDLPLLDTTMAVFACLGFGYSIFRLKSEKYFFPLAWFLIGMTGGFLSMHVCNPNTQRCILAMPTAPLFAAIGLALSWNLLRSSAKPLLRRLVAMAAALLIIISILTNLKLYFQDYKHHPQVHSAFFYVEALVPRLARQAAKTSNVSISSFYSYSPVIGFLNFGFQYRYFPALHLDEFLINNDNKDAVYITEPIYADLEPYLREYYPNIKLEKTKDHAPGIFWRFKDKYAHPDLLLLTYRIPQADIAALSGLNERLFAASGQPLPQDKNFFDSLADSRVRQAEWQGYLYIPSYTSYSFRADTAGQISVQVDGREVFSSTRGSAPAKALYQGLHHVKINYQKLGTDTTELSLLWQYGKYTAGTTIAKKYFLKKKVAGGLMGNYYKTPTIDPAGLVEIKLEPLICFRSYMGAGRGLNWPFTALWQGLLKVKQPGQYLIEGHHRSLMTIYVDGKKIFHNDVTGLVINEPIELSTGSHRLRIKCLWSLNPTGSEGNHSVVQLYWTPPDGEKEIIPYYALGH